MCYIEANGKLHPTGNANETSGGDRHLKYGSTTYALKSLGNTLKFIGS